MATAGVWDPNYMMNRRALLESIANANQPGRPNFMGGSATSLASGIAAPAAPAVDNGFGNQQSALDRFFQLKTAEALQQAAKRANEFSATRGMSVDGGQNVQMEQELADQAIGQINQQQAGANADLMAQQRAYQLQQQQMAAQQAQFRQQQQMAQQQAQWEQQYKNKLYQDMRNASTGAGAPQRDAAANPFNTLFNTGQSSTASISGSPAIAGSTFGQSNLASHNAPAFGTPKQPDRVFTETRDQAAARGANLNGPTGYQSASSTLGSPFSSAANWAVGQSAAATGNQLAGTSASFMTRR